MENLIIYFIDESKRIQNDKSFYEQFGWNIFDGKYGAKRLAFNFKQYIKLNNINIDVKSTYSTVYCVIMGLKPFVNNKEWIEYLK